MMGMEDDPPFLLGSVYFQGLLLLNCQGASFENSQEVIFCKNPPKKGGHRGNPVLCKGALFNMVHPRKSGTLEKEEIPALEIASFFEDPIAVEKTLVLCQWGELLSWRAP